MLPSGLIQRFSGRWEIPTEGMEAYKARENMEPSMVDSAMLENQEGRMIRMWVQQWHKPPIF